MLGEFLAGEGPTSTVSGALTFNNSAKTIDVFGAANLDLQANLSAGSVIKEGSGRLRLAGVNSSLSGVTLNNGTLLIGGNQALGANPLIVNGGTLASDGISRIVSNAAVFAGDGIVDEPASLTLQSLAGAGSLVKNGAGTLAFTSPSTFFGAMTLNAGTLSANLTATNSFTQNGGTFSGSLLIQGTFAFNGGAFLGTLTNEGSALVNSDLTVSAGVENRGTFSVPLSRTLTVNGAGLRNLGTLTLNGGVIAGSGGILNDFSGQMNARGTLNSGLSNFGILQTTGLLSASLGGSNFGVINIFSTQSLALGNSFTNNGTINLYSGSISGSAPILNASGGQIQGGGGVSVALTNGGGLILANSSSPMIITSLSGNNSGGELRIADFSSLNVFNPFASSGTIVLQGASSNLSGGAINNTGTISGKGRINNTINNSGVIRAEGGLLTLAGAGATNTASGSIQAPAAATVFYSQGLATNAGSISLSGGTFDTNATAITNTGIIDGRGIFRSGTLTNNNKIAIADGASEIYGSVINNGSLTITNTTATFFNNVTNNVGGVIKTTGAV